MPGNPLTDPNWAASVTDQIVNAVDAIRARTTRPVVLAARGAVYGLLAGIVGLVALTLFVIAFFRGLQAILEWPFSHATAVWVSYVVVGALLCIGGIVSMLKRHGRQEEHFRGLA